MDYWQGYMNWPLSKDWVCEICGEKVWLEWGMMHAQCRCSLCHTQYRMKDDKDKMVDIPICQIKPEYYETWKKLWQNLHKPLEQITDEEWESVGMTADKKQEKK